MKFLKPTKDFVYSSYFGVYRNYSFAPNRLQKHEGLDFAPKNPEEVSYIYAAQDGTIVKTGFDPTGYGNYVVIKHDERYSTWYAHLEKILIDNYKVVKAGEIIGIMGTTGNSTGKHLHFNITDQVNGLYNYVVAKVVDPLPLLVDTIHACIVEKPLYTIINGNISEILSVHANKNK